MPVWAQIVIGASAVVLAVGVLWNKVVRPLAKMITLAEKMLPLQRILVDVFEKTPDALRVVGEIAAQFRTDSGSSLRDVVNRLEAAAIENRRAAEFLAVGVASQKELAQIDRENVQRALLSIDRLTVKVEAGADTAKRIEKHASHVADDLAAAHKRADETVSDTAGAAADAAAQQTVREIREDREG